MTGPAGHDSPFLHVGWMLEEDGKTPKRVPNTPEGLVEWARWWEDFSKRRVAETVVGPLRVSTVFLAIDHNFWGSGPPVLWETLLFPTEMVDYMERYSSYEDAVKGHQRAVLIAEAMAAAHQADSSDSQRPEQSER